MKHIYFRIWRPAVLVASLGLIAYLLYFHRLSTLLPGYSTSELTAYKNASNWHTILANPINLPYKAFVWLFTAVLHHSIYADRVISAVFATLAVLVFYTIIRPWYGFRAAFLGSILFATSSGLLHSARLGTGQVLQMSILVFLGAVLWYRRTQNKQILVGYGMVALFGLLWYIPGMLWFELLGIVLLRRGVLRKFSSMSRPHLAGWIALFLAVITPLVVASVKNSHIALVASGLPQNIDSLSDIPSNVLNAVMSVGVRSDGNPLWWVGHTPLLGAVELVLGLAGGYYYLHRERSARTIFLTGSLALSLLLMSFGGSVNFACLVPLVYLFVASGLHHLLGQWLAVFPRNPIARFAGVGLICIMLGFAVLYQVRSYFVAWPNIAATRQTFNHRQP